MSHPTYNPYASGNQGSNQGQYGLPNIDPERDPRRTSSRLGPGSSFSTAGTSSATSANTGGMPPSVLPQSMNFRHDQNRSILDENKERSIDIIRAREEARHLGKPMTSPQMDEHFYSGMVSYPMPSTSASQGHRHSGVESGSSSVDWLSNYKRPAADDPSKLYSSSAPSTYASSGDGRFNASSEREHDMQSIPGLGDFDYPVPDRPAAPTESSQPKYTSESASNILLRFGLEKEDLEHLISYPEDQITPASLPFILRQIRIDKTKRATTAAQSKPCPKPQPTRSVSGMDSHSLSSSGGAGMRQEEISSAILQPSKVIDYGHTGKYTGAVRDEIGGISSSRANSGGSGSMLLMNTYDSIRPSREPLQKNTTEVKSSALGSSYEQRSSVSSLSSSHSSILSSVAPPSNDQTKRSQTQPTQSAQKSSFSLPKKDTDIRALKSKAPMNEPEADRQSLKNQPPNILYRGVHPSRPGLVVIGSNEASCTKDQSKTQGQGLTVVEMIKKQQLMHKQMMQQAQQQPKQTMQQAQQQPKQTMQQAQHQPKQTMQQTQHQPKQTMQQAQQQPKQTMHKQTMQQTQQQPKQTMHKQTMQQAQQQPKQQTGEMKWPPVFSAAKSAPPASPISSINAMQRPVFIPGGPYPIGNPPAVPQPVPSQMSLIHLTPPPSKRLPTAQVEISKGLPTASMMHDFAATPPRIFPHTCSLCFKECTHIKAWIAHQNTSLHLENCNLLQRRYPEWDGQIPRQPSAAGKDAKPAPSTSLQTSKHRQQKIRRSRSPSPRRRHGSEDRRGNRSSRSRSRSPWYDRPSSTQYRSRSPKRRSSPKTRDEKWSSTKKRDDRRSPPRRSYDSRSPPRRSYEISSPLRMGDERPSPSWWSDQRVSPSRWSDQRASPSQWSDQRSSPPRRTDEMRSPPKRSKKRRSPPKRSDQRRSPQRKKSSSAETLAKNLLETPALQSLSNMSDLETMVKTLAPALLAELAKLKSSSPSSSSSSVGRKPTSSSTASSSSSTVKKKLLATKPSKAKPSLQRSEASSSTKTKSGKYSPPNMVKLRGVRSSLSHDDLLTAVEQFGETTGIEVIQSKQEATVYFKREENAKKLKSVKTLDVKGISITIVREMNSKQQKKPPQKKPATSTVSKGQTSCSVVTQATADKFTNQKSALKGPMKAKVLVSKAKNVSTKQITKMVKTGKLPKKGAVMPDAKVVEKLVVEPRHQAELVEANDAKGAGLVVIGEMGVEVAKPVEFGSCAEGQRETRATTEENSADKTSESQPPSSTIQTRPTETSSGSKSTAPKNLPEQHSKPKESETNVQESVLKAKVVEKAAVDLKRQEELDKANDAKGAGPVVTVKTGLTETSVKALLQVQQSTQSEPQSSAQGPETNTEASLMQQQAAGSNAVTTLTVGERLEHHLNSTLIACRKIKACFTEEFGTLRNQNLLITNLPVYQDNYTEDYFVQLLEPFGFQYPGKHELYVFPQTRMAFVCMLDGELVTKMIDAAFGNCFRPLNGSRPFFRPIHSCVELKPFVFYKWLMALMGFSVVDDGAKTVLIKNISSSEIGELREVLTVCQSVKNYMPLLNKVFIEFESLHDADQLGVLYSLLEPTTGHEVHRLNIPYSGKTSPPPGPPRHAPSDSKDVVAGANVGPFWLTMRTSPFLFPTASPCFTSPDHLTVRHQDDIEAASGRCSTTPTVMLTGLPEGNYKHEDVAQLVWRYFPEQNLHSLYYNVVVLPLQRRAFVFFADLATCCDFVRDHVKKPVSVNDCELQVHFVLQHMGPESSEEMMYTSMMKWSNPGAPEPKSLQERLLCVEISETSADVIGTVVEVVASIATFVSFLPLANRICIEMADSILDTPSVTKVLENYNLLAPNCPGKLAAWSKVQRVESLKSLKARLRESSGITLSLEAQSMNVPAVTSESQPVTAGPSATAAMKDDDASKCTTSLTIGEIIEKRLFKYRIRCMNMAKYLSSKPGSQRRTQLLITNLPQFNDGCFTEEDIAKLLMPFGFEYADDNIYVVPQTRMAFVSMPKVKKLPKLEIYLKSSKFVFHPLPADISVTPLVFYKWLMRTMDSPVGDIGERIVFIKNISWSETKELREALRKIQSVKNFLPLLNKVFIEFEWFQDADRLGVWYSLLKRAPLHQVQRLKVPYNHRTFCAPRLPENALPDSADAVAGAIIPPMAFGIPEGSFGPCWVMMRTRPFLFPTMSPWFIIPDYLTIRGYDDIKAASSRGSTTPTVMLTGLPEGNYKHEDVAKLVWPYFPEQNLHSLYYNVVVLPLQRRAFVFFPDWTTCCKFVQDDLKSPAMLTVHIVLQDMGPRSSEEMMYTTMMKWSNAGVPESKSLEERLLCVEISETSVDVIRVVMEAVASIATFVSFLPLANRICIEMADSILDTPSVTKVLENYNLLAPNCPGKLAAWSKVQRVESLKSLKARLRESSGITLSLEAQSMNVPAVTSEPQPVTAGPSATAAMKDNDPVTAAKTQTDASKCTTSLTIGEIIEKRLLKHRIKCMKMKYYRRSKPGSQRMQFLITNLPQFNDGCYTEEDIAKLLMPFGFEYADDNIYVVPQTGMAFVSMPKVKNLQELEIYLNSSKFLFHPLPGIISVTPLVFYKWLMRTMDSPVGDVGERIVFIKNISWSETKELREALRKIQSVKNFLPLLNKVFVEFKCLLDADRLGVWYSLLKRAPLHQVQRLKVPKNLHVFCPPRVPENALPDSADAVAGAIIPPKAFGVPKGSFGPCWVMMRTRPFLFPTMSPWFIIPDYLTIRGYDDIKTASGRGSTTPTVMLTGLPEGNYKHEDVAKLVWRYFPEQNLHSLYYNVVVLPLQRRAFVFFPDWTTCCKFVQDDLESPAHVKDAMLTVHIVLQDMGPGSSEEMMYTTMMKWSNAGVPESKSLEERLLCVEVSETSVDVIRVVMEAVASIATFVSFLPLANRICIEMADSSGAAKVVEKYNTFSSDSEGKVAAWSKVKRFELLQSLKQRLKVSKEINLYLEPFQPITSKSPTEEKEGCDDIVSSDKKSDSSTVSPKNSSEPTKPATSQEDSLRVQDDGSLAKQLCEEDAISAGDKSNKNPFCQNQETSSDRGSKPAPMDKEDGEKTKAEEVKDQIANEDQPVQDPDGNLTEQETFEILDSIDDHTATEDDSHNLETPSEQISKEDIRPMDDEEEDTYQVIDSVEEQSTTTETESETDKGKSNKRAAATDRRDDGPSKRSGSTTTSSKSEEDKSPKKQDRTEKTNETQKKVDTTAAVSKKDKEFTEEVMYKIVDSVEDEPVQDFDVTERSGRRSARGRNEDTTNIRLTDRSEKSEADYRIIDSVEDETGNDEPTRMTRSTRRKRERTTASNEKTKREETPTKRRYTPVRESREQNRGKKPRKEETEQDATFELIDSVEDEVVEDDQPSIRSKEDASEEEATYQILDSVEEEMVDDQPPSGQSEKKNIKKNDWQTKRTESLAGSPKHEEEDEPMYQIVDSLEDDQAQEEFTTIKDETHTKEETLAEKVDAPTCGRTTKVVKASENVVAKESLYLIVDESSDDPSAAEGSCKGNKGSTPKTDKPTTESQTNTAILERESKQNSPEEGNTTSTNLLNLDEVSEEEENYPEDVAEEEKLNRWKATAREKQFAKEQDMWRTRERGERERQSSSRVEEGGRGGMRRMNERGSEKEKTVGVDAKELVTLDEVGADKLGEERAPENREYDGEMTEAELQALVTLDEFVEEEDDGKAEQSMLVTLPASQKQESVDFLNPEGQKDFTNDIASSDSCVFDEQNFNMDDFVTVDEVGDEVGDKSPKPHSSSSTRQSSRARRERQSPGVSSDGKWTSTRSLKESKSSASSSSRSTKGSSSSVSPKKSKDSSEPTKSHTKPFASASVSKATSSYPVSTETPSSPGQKTQQSKTKSPAKASTTASSGRSTRSSFASHETEEKVPLATVEASIMMPSVPLDEETQETESAVAKSDSKVPAEGIAAKSVESDTKIETSERHPPLQGHGLELNQAQSLEIDCNVSTLKDRKTSKEKGKEDDVDKHPEVEEDEKYHILDSLDDQTDEPMNDSNQDGSSEAQPTGPKEGKTSHKESFQDSFSDEDKARPQEYDEMEMDGSFQVLDSVTEDKAATGQEESNLVQDDSSTVKQLSEEDAVSEGDKSEDSVGEDQATNDVDHFQDPRNKGDEKKRKKEEVTGKMLSTESCTASKDMDSLDSQILNEDQPLEDPNNKDTLEDPDIDVTEQETFEILDSIGQTEDDSQTFDTPREQISIEDIGSMEEEEDTYRVIDSVEDQPTPPETESESGHGKIKIGEATARKERPSKRSGPTTTLSKSKKIPKKQDRTVKKYETRAKMNTPAGVSKKDKDFSEEMEYEIVDSVEEDSVQDPVSAESARAKKESQEPEEASYEIIDSVEDDIANYEPTIMTRSTKGKRESTTKKDEDMPTRRRHIPIRESQQRNRDNTPKKEAPPKESTPSKKRDNVREVIEENTTYEEAVSVDDAVVQDVQPATRRQGKRGRPKKDVKSTKNASATLNKGDKAASEKVADEEEQTYQILDSLEEEMVDDQPLAPSREELFQNDKTKKSTSPKNEDEEEPIYQIVDSVEDDQAQEEFTASEDKTEESTSAKKEDTPTCGITVLEAFKRVVIKEEVVDDSQESEGSASGNMESIPKKDMSKGVILERENKQKTPEKDDTTSALANLDEVSEEEEDYPDDVAEEEELKKRQATAKEKQFGKKREASRTREREPRSRSSSGGMRRAKETVEVDAKELVKLDEVGADEAGEERAPESQEYDGEMTDAELQALVTLDEFVEEEEDRKAEQSSLDESVDFFNLDNMMTLDEAGDEEEKPDEAQAEETSRSVKHIHDDETEESMNFVTVDEVGEVDEEEEKEVIETRTRGQAKKRTRQTPVRKSTIGKKVTVQEEKEEEKKPVDTDVVPPTPCDASSSMDKDLCTLSSDGQPDIQKTEAEVEAVSRADIDAGQEAQPEKSEEEDEREGQSRADIKVESKQRREPAGPEAKQPRSQSPCVSADNNPLGQEFVVPKSGYFCNLCSVFYLNESTAKDRHCNSRRHQDNLKKHYQKLQQKP